MGKKTVFLLSTVRFPPHVRHVATLYCEIFERSCIMNLLYSDVIFVPCDSHNRREHCTRTLYKLLCIDTEAESRVFGSSSHELTAYGSGDSQPTFSRFYRSLSSESDTSNDSELVDPDQRNRSQSPIPHQPSIFFLEHSLSDEGASAAGTTTSSIRPADNSPIEPSLSASVEFRNLLKTMFGREGSSCVPEDDRPAHHGSLGNFVVPKGSFGSAILPHVSSFG